MPLIFSFLLDLRSSPATITTEMADSFVYVSSMWQCTLASKQRSSGCVTTMAGCDQPAQPHPTAGFES